MSVVSPRNYSATHLIFVNSSTMLIAMAGQKLTWLWMITNGKDSWRTRMPRFNDWITSMKRRKKITMSMSLKDTLHWRIDILSWSTIRNIPPNTSFWLSEVKALGAKPSRSTILASVGHPVVPNIPGREHVITSDDAFFLEKLPKKVVIVGKCVFLRLVINDFLLLLRWWIHCDWIRLHLQWIRLWRDIDPTRQNHSHSIWSRYRLSHAVHDSNRRGSDVYWQLTELWNELILSFRCPIEIDWWIEEEWHQTAVWNGNQKRWEAHRWWLPSEFQEWKFLAGDQSCHVCNRS